MDNIEAEKRLRKLEKALPKIKREKQYNPKNHKLGLLIRVQTIVTVAFLSWFIFSIAFPPFFWPVNAHVTSEFLFRLKPDSLKKGIEIHHGIDLGVPVGTSIFPSAMGIVSTTNSSVELGNYVIVDHILGFSTLYAHLSNINTHKGSLVFPGVSKIGSSGNTGRSTGPHLHFSIRINNFAVPPRFLLLFHSIRKIIIKF